MITLHYYSNTIGVRLETIEEEDEYSLDKIKEFEEVDPAWQETLNALLQGMRWWPQIFVEGCKQFRQKAPGMFHWTKLENLKIGF